MKFEYEVFTDKYLSQTGFVLLSLYSAGHMQSAQSKARLLGQLAKPQFTFLHANI